MHTCALKALTWATVVTALLSAVWLAAEGPNLPGNNAAHRAAPGRQSAHYSAGDEQRRQPRPDAAQRSQPSHLDAGSH